MNILFEYLYRDAGNFKLWGEVIFSNKNNHDAKWLEQQARNVLISTEFFIGEKADIPILQFKEYIKALDHDWYEFISFMPTAAESNDLHGRDVTEFLKFLEAASVTYY